MKDIHACDQCGNFHDPIYSDCATGEPYSRKPEAQDQSKVPVPEMAPTEWKWICEYCFTPSYETNLPDTWDWILQSAICPQCRQRAMIDGGIYQVKGGAYANGKPDPRALLPERNESSSARGEEVFVEKFGPMTISTGYGYDIARYAETQKAKLAVWEAAIEWTRLLFREAAHNASLREKEEAKPTYDSGGARVPSVWREADDLIIFKLPGIEEFRISNEGAELLRDQLNIVVERLAAEPEPPEHSTLPVPRMERLLAIKEDAHEWAAKFPLGGTADAEAAFGVYALCQEYDTFMEEAKSESAMSASAPDSPLSSPAP